MIKKKTVGLEIPVHFGQVNRMVTPCVNPMNTESNIEKKKERQ